MRETCWRPCAIFSGGADLGYSVSEVIDPRWVLQIGVAPVRIDLLSAIPGFTSFTTAWKNRVEARFGSIPAHYLSLDDPIAAKAATGRPQDRADLRILRRLKAGPKLARTRNR